MNLQVLEFCLATLGIKLQILVWSYREDEATLPIKSDVAPYYHWNDFREYCLKKLAYPSAILYKRCSGRGNDF